MAEIGSVIDGKYEILTEIGHGGMSVVYLAMQFDESGKLIISEDTHIHVLSYDEKPGIQAIATTSDAQRYPC